jgi:hypothetical protein
MLGASRAEQLVENFEALAVLERLDDATWKRVEASTAS